MSSSLWRLTLEEVEMELRDEVAVSSAEVMSLMRGVTVSSLAVPLLTTEAKGGKELMVLVLHGLQ